MRFHGHKGGDAVDPRDSIRDRSASRSCRERGYAGPYVRFVNIFPATGEWLGTILFLNRSHDDVVDEGAALDAAAPALRVSRGKAGPARALDVAGGWIFWCFELRVQLDAHGATFEYSIDNPRGGSPGPFTVHVPGRKEQLHWGYYSCNGLSLDVKPENPVLTDELYLWRDLLKVHGQFPMHLVFGGGDQVYSDAVWRTKALSEWCDLPGFYEKIAAEFSESMKQEAIEFYVDNYIDHLSPPSIAQAMATIPQLMCWDDHDIWDGYGSYEPAMQNCPVFQGLFAVAKRFYLLYQKHTTPELAVQSHEYMGDATKAYHSLHYLGPSTALLVLDMRSQRTMTQCFGDEGKRIARLAALALPESVGHLVVASGVPVVWPAVPLSEKIATVVDYLSKRSTTIRNLLKKAGILDQFEQPEILDDMRDGWMADVHAKERKAFLNMLLEVSQIKHMRISILSGDAHVAGVGRVYTKPRIRPLSRDPSFMAQITSSAIVNAPPPHLVARMLTSTNWSKKVKTNVRQKMVREFKLTSASKVLGARNWCDVTMVAPPYTPPLLEDDDMFGGLRFMIRTENVRHRCAALEVAERREAALEAGASGHADRIYSVMVPAWKVNDGKRGELSSEEQAKVREARRELASVSAPLPSIFFELEDRPDPTPSPVV